MAIRQINNALLESMQTDANGMPMNAIRNNSTGNMLQIMSSPNQDQGPQLDYTRPMIQLADGRKGYYGKKDPLNVYDAEGQLLSRGYRESAAELNRNDELNYISQRRQLELENARLQQQKIQQELSGARRPAAPAGYRFTQDGSLEAIPGGPAGVEKPLTEFQGKSATYGTRAQESSNIIDQVGEGGKVQPSLIKRAVEGVPLIGGALGMAANATVASPKQQQIEQAQRDFINASLRQESGAAIAETEFDNARKQYFPQPGDSPEVIKQKAANRETAIKGFQVNAGSGWNRMQQPSQASGMQTGQVVDGYKFLGGNPADKTRWMKVQ